MAVKTPLKRKYDSSRRKEQARLTRLRIAEAARRLFMERGYAGASIEAIAAEAGVAKETVYSIFTNKRNVLAFLLDISIGGDDEPIKVLDRPGPRAVMSDTDQRRQLSGFSRDIAEIMERAAPVFEIVRDAAKIEPEIQERLELLLQERLRNMTRFVHSVAANGPLREGLDEARASETVWALSSPDLFHLMIAERGWPKEKYSQWLGDILARYLLP
jgi:AcrR family transcriptional regulator